MKLVTRNVDSLKARLPRVLEFLENERPDVACLQETKVAAGAFPAEELQAAGYRAHHHSGGRWAGVAVLARDDVALEPGATGLPGERAPEEARWCEATAGGLRVASAYVTNGRAVRTPGSSTRAPTCTPASSGSRGGTTARATSTAAWGVVMSGPLLTF